MEGRWPSLAPSENGGHTQGHNRLYSQLDRQRAVVPCDLFFFARDSASAKPKQPLQSASPVFLPRTTGTLTLTFHAGMKVYITNKRRATKSQGAILHSACRNISKTSYKAPLVMP